MLIMLRDIRELMDDPAAYAAELQRRWGGLLSYRYIGRAWPSMDTGPIEPIVTVRQDMRNSTGGLLLAVLGISSPEGGGVSDRDAVPNPVIHSCQILDPGRDVGRIEICSEQIKRGQKMSYSRSLIVDADAPQRVLAVTAGQGVSLAPTPGEIAKMPPNPIEVVDSPDLPPLTTVFGAHRRDNGDWALPELSVEFASPDAALHLGPQFVALEAACQDAAATALDSQDLQGVSSHVMFLARGKVGPFRVEAEPLIGADGTIVVRALMFDEGIDDRAVTSASYQFRKTAAD